MMNQKDLELWLKTATREELEQHSELWEMDLSFNLRDLSLAEMRQLAKAHLRYNAVVERIEERLGSKQS